MADNQNPTTPSQEELRTQMNMINQRNFLAEIHQDTRAADMSMSPENTADAQGYQLPTEQPHIGEIDSALYYNFLDQALREDGQHNVADGIAHHPSSGHRAVLPGDALAHEFHPMAENVRTHWRNTREDLSLEAVQKTTDGVGFWKDLAAQVLGSTPAQIAIGGMEPLARSQQVLFGALAGEGNAAWSRLFPSVVLESHVDEFGVPIESSPWSATIDAVWSKMRGDGEQYEKDIARLRAVNAAYMNEDLLEISDIFDARIGEDGMDEFYASMDDNGFLGKVAMGATSLAYAAGEVFVDPLIVFDYVPTMVTKGLKAGSSTATRAAKTAQVARKTRRLPDALTAKKAASTHLNAAHADYLRAPHDPKAHANLKNAMNLYAERVDEVEWFRRQPLDAGGDQFDFINPTGPARRKPSTILTTEVEKQRGDILGAGTPYERGMRDDMAKGIYPDELMFRSPETTFRLRLGKDIKLESVGRQPQHQHNSTLDVMEAMAEKLGIRVIPYESSGMHDGPAKLAGAYWPGSRTITMNMTRDSGHEVMTTFLHEVWHHIFHTQMSAEKQSKVLEGLVSAGFDVEEYTKAASKVSPDYQFKTGTAAADEFTARSLSEMAVNPEFWDTLRRLDPETFEMLSRDASQLVIDSIPYVDSVGGHTPSGWLPDKQKIGGIAEMIYDEDGWIQHQRRVLKAIDSAYHKDPELLLRHQARITRNVTEVRDQMLKDRDAIRSTGRKTPVLDKEIERAEAYLQKIADEGTPAIMDDYKWRAESLRRLTTDEVAAAVAAERRIASTHTTEAIQPSRQPTWGVDADGNEVFGVYEQADLFDDATPMADEIADRIANGPDDAEYAAEGLMRLVHGASPDDIAARLNNIPERQATTGGRIVPGTRRNMLDTDQINRTLWRAKKRAKAMGQELWETSNDAYVLQQALNDIKLPDTKVKITKGKKGPAGPRPAKKFSDQPYDDSWLPKVDKRKAEQKMGDDWWDNHQANVFDRIATGLYPHTWRIKWPAMIRSTIMNFREPMRVLEDIDPGKSWPLLRGAMFNAENETTRLTSVFHGAMERFGAITIDEPSTLAKMLRSGQKEKVSTNAHMSERLFDILDMSPSDSNYPSQLADLTAAQREAVVDIRNELNLIADRLGITNTEKFIDGYIHHAFDENLYAKGGMPPEHAGMSRSGNLFLGALLKRNGMKGYKRDAVGALEVYARGVGRKLHMEPALKQFRERAMWHAKADTRNAFFLEYADMTIAQLRGEPSLLGSLMDKVAGGISRSTGTPYKPGAASRKVATMTNLIYSSLLAGNRRYPIMSIATALATTGAKFGMFRTVKGLFKMATPEGQMLFKRMGGDKQFKRIFESDLMSNKLNELTGVMTDLRPASMSVTDTENFIRGMAFWASIDESLSRLGFSDIRMADEQGFMSEVLWEAMRTTEEVNHFFGAASKPPAFSRISKTGAVAGSQFLSFPFKQSETLLGLFKDDPGNIARFMMLSGWVGRVGAQDLGIDVQEYVGLSSSVPKLGDLQSPAVALLASMARAMGTLNALSQGYATAEDAKEAVDEFIKAGEVALPGLRLAREIAQAAEMDVTGRKETPGLGYGREVDAEYINIGDRISLPIPSGKKGHRSEVVGIATGARTIEETLHQKARARVRMLVNESAIERMELVSKAKRAMDSGNWEDAQKHMQRMAEMGFPIGDITDPIQTKQEIDILDWNITTLKRNPDLAHKLIPILQEYGIIGGTDAENQ